MATNKSGDLLIADGNKFKPVSVRGEVTIDQEGLTTLTQDILLNSHIRDNANIDISKTNLLRVKDTVLIYLLIMTRKH